MKKGLLILFSVLCLMGCVGTAKYVPKQAITNPGEGISILHPVELEKTGVENIVIFSGLLDPGLWVEVVNAGGVWPFLAESPNGILSGYCYLVGLTYWGDWQIQFVFIGEKKELRDAKIVYFNRDMGYAYQLNGRQIPYNPKEFDQKEDYRKDFFKEFGMTLSELDSFWKEYFISVGLNPPEDLTSATEISIPSKEWDDYKKKVAEVMPHNYKMADGKIRCGYLPLKSFKKEAVIFPGFNGAERYLDKAKLPLVALPFTGVGLLATVGANVLGDAVVAGVDDDWKGSYARAKTLRQEMAPLFRQITILYKELLRRRDKEIQNLRIKLILGQ